MIELKYEIKHANASLDEIMGIFTEINSLYRDLKDKKASDEIIVLAFDKCQLSEDNQNNDTNSNSKDPSRREKPYVVHFTSDNENPGNLTGKLEDLNGAPLETLSLPKHRCAQTVSKIGRELTRKYGKSPTKELEKKYQQEFETMQDEDYGNYEFLILDFFLKNLYLLK